ncbi:MAG: hypothetical protein Q9211_001783, partial [Gyalolechia sp. 1 TL-2023]
KTTPREFKPRISRTKGHLSKRTAFVREIVKEVSGYVFAPAMTNIFLLAATKKKKKKKKTARGACGLKQNNQS